MSQYEKNFVNTIPYIDILSVKSSLSCQSHHVCTKFSIARRSEYIFLRPREDWTRVYRDMLMRHCTGGQLLVAIMPSMRDGRNMH